MRHFVLFALMASSCSGVETNQSAAPSQAVGQPTASSSSRASSTVESLRADVAAAYGALESAYGQIWPEEFARALSGARDEWNRRIDRCGDDPCRIGLLQDQVNRARYAVGRNDRPVEGMRWDRGAFTFDEAGIDGSLAILPIIDDRVLVVGGSSQSPDGRWVCELYAEGRSGPGAAFEVTTLDELRQNYRLERLSPRRLRLTYLLERTDPNCGLNGTLTGTYRLSPRRDGPATSTH